MKKCAVFILIAFTSMAAFCQDKDPVLIRSGETFVTNNNASYSWGCGTNLFLDSENNLHGAYVDNYKIFYLFSSDQGQTWDIEQLVTGYEGKIKNCGIAVTTNGKVFIPFEIHPNLNYGGAPVGYPEFINIIYCAVSNEEDWDITMLLPNNPGLNQGHFLGDVLVDNQDNVHVYSMSYGWYYYGGAITENIFSSETEEWSTQVVVEYNDAPIDNVTLYPKAAINTNGDIAIIFWRTHFLRYDYVIKPNGEGWQAAQNLDSNPTYRGYNIVAGPDGDFHMFWVTGENPFTINIQHGFDGTPYELITGEPDQSVGGNLHVDQAGRVTFINSRLNPFAAVIYIKESPEEDWEEETVSFPSSSPVGGLFQVKKPQGNFSHLQVLFLNYTRQGSFGPHGPDHLFFWQYFNTKELSLSSEPEGAGTLTGEGEYPIDSTITVSAEPLGDHMFLRWQDSDGNTVSTEPVFSFAMPYSDLTLTALFQSTAAVDPLVQGPPVQIFPNPSPNGIFNLVLDREVSVRVFNLEGRAISSSRLKEGKNILDLSGNPSGIYALEFFGRDASLSVRVIIL
jgi:hypothetical protein